MDFGVTWLRWELELHQIGFGVKVMVAMVLQVAQVFLPILLPFLVILHILAQIQIAIVDATVKLKAKVNAHLVLMVVLGNLDQMV